MNEKKILFGIAAGTLAIAAALGYGVYYTLGSISDKETEAQAKHEEIVAAQKKIDEIKKLEDRVIVLRESVAALASVLPTQKEVEEFVTQIAASKGEAGIIMHNLTPKQGGAIRANQSKVFEKTSYQIGLKGSLWQFLEFLHRVESFKRFVMVPRLRISAGQRDKAFADVTHAFEIDVETFAYNPGRAAAAEPIASYEKRREGLREEVEQAKYTIEQPPVEFGGQRGHRDIFVDPRVPTNGMTADGAAPIEQQTETVSKLRIRVEEITNLLAKMKDSQSFIERFEVRAQLDDKLPALDADIEKISKEGTITYPLLARTFQNEVKDSFAKIKKIVAAAPADSGPSARELADVVGRVRDALTAGRIREAIDGAKPALDKAASIEKDAARKGYIDELRKLDHDARIAERFEQKKVVIGGIVLYEDRKAALVNGRAVEPGDSIDEDLTIADIHEDGVTFVLDSVQITKKW